MDCKNKRILFMGDSITELGTSERGWVRYFNEMLTPEKYVITAVIGARLANESDVQLNGQPLFCGDDTDYNQNVLLNQIEKIKNGISSGETDYDYFDIIMIAAGTNDPFSAEKCDISSIEKQFTAPDGTVLPSECVDRKTWAGAMRIIYEELRALYKDARIFFCSPVQAAEQRRSYASIYYKRNLMKEICLRLSDVYFVDTFSCGICNIYEVNKQNGRDLIDGLHPNVSGARKIGEYNAKAVVDIIG